MSYEEFLELVVTEIESTRVLSLPDINTQVETTNVSTSDELIVQ